MRSERGFMALSVYQQRSYGQVVSPVTPVRPVMQRAPDRNFERSLSVVPDQPSPSDVLRTVRAETLAELTAPHADGAEVSASRFRGLDRDQLASMVYDRQSGISLAERRGALKQLEENDRVFLDRALELAEISGDDRVRLSAELQLAEAKGAIERAVPKSEEGPSPALLRQQIAAKTAEFGGAPVGISLRYPNGLVAEDKALPLPDSLGVSNVSPGATRAALAYRESMF